jgi:TfoX/Sxy family transcriptional regulator of competence genes
LPEHNEATDSPDVAQALEIRRRSPPPTDQCHAAVDEQETSMAYDEDLAERIRELIAGERRVSEKKMFGGLAFLIGGNMAIAASGQGGLLVRADPDRSDRILASTHARPMEMRGREMTGWLRVEADDVRTKRQLARWVDIGVSSARSLPPKR